MEGENARREGGNAGSIPTRGGAPDGRGGDVPDGSGDGVSDNLPSLEAEAADAKAGVMGAAGNSTTPSAISALSSANNLSRCSILVANRA